MLKALYPVFDYLYDHPRVRTAVFYALNIVLFVLLIPLEWWRYMLAIILVIFIQWHGLIEGAATADEAHRKSAGENT